jgi:hypothetical protein
LIADIGGIRVTATTVMLSFSIAPAQASAMVHVAASQTQARSVIHDRFRTTQIAAEGWSVARMLHC